MFSMCTELPYWTARPHTLRPFSPLAARLSTLPRLGRFLLPRDVRRGHTRPSTPRPIPSQQGPAEAEQFGKYLYCRQREKS
jgi:hypothetical protein